MPTMIPMEHPWLGDDEAAAATTTTAIASGWIAQGPWAAEFEAAFADSIGASHAVALSSCTIAVHLALDVARIGPGDEVIVPSLSCSPVQRRASQQPVIEFGYPSACPRDD